MTNSKDRRPLTETDPTLLLFERIANNPDVPRLLGKVVGRVAKVRRVVLGFGDRISERGERMVERAKEKEAVSLQKLEAAKNELASLWAVNDAERIVREEFREVTSQTVQVLRSTEAIIEMEAGRIEADIPPSNNP